MGALYGAFVGVNMIPSNWIDTMLKFKQEKERVKKYAPLNHKNIYQKLMLKLMYM